MRRRFYSKSLGERIGDMGKPMRDGDGDGKCRERGKDFVPCPPGVPAGTLLGSLLDPLEIDDGVDLELFRNYPDEPDEELSYNLERRALYEDWQQWAECRAIRAAAYAIVSGSESPADPHLRRTGRNRFGDPGFRSSASEDDEKMQAEARFLLNSLAYKAINGDAEYRPLYRAVDLPRQQAQREAFLEALQEGKIVDLPLISTSNKEREGTNQFLQAYGRDFILEIEGPSVGMTAGAINTLVDEDQENETLALLDAISYELDAEEESDLGERLRDAIEAYEKARSARDVRSLEKRKEELLAIVEEAGVIDIGPLRFAGDELEEGDPGYWDKIDDLSEEGVREVITGGRFQVISVTDIDDGPDSYGTRVRLRQIGVFDPRDPGAIIPIRVNWRRDA